MHGFTFCLAPQAFLSCAVWRVRFRTEALEWKAISAVVPSRPVGKNLMSFVGAFLRPIKVGATLVVVGFASPATLPDFFILFVFLLRLPV